jgi:KDO2-lipid IV(A) lauroyltransferase
VNPAPKHRIEYGILRVLASVACVLPYRAALTVGWGLAWAAFHMARWRVPEARRRIEEAFGDRFDEGAVRRIAWVSLRNFAFSLIEALRMPRMTRAWVERTTDCAAVEQVRTVLGEGRGAILVIPHMGSWETAGVAAALLGLPVFFIVGHQKNPLVDAYANRLRGITGVETIPRDAAALRKTVKNLREGRVLAFMTDLRSRTPGVAVRFLGRDANLVAGMGVFAKIAGAPVVPAVVTRVGWARHRWRTFEPVRPDPALDRDADARRMTQHVMDVFERAIREEPEQYFWFNKRWVLDPLEDGPPA